MRKHIIRNCERTERKNELGEIMGYEYMRGDDRKGCMINGKEVRKGRENEEEGGENKARVNQLGGEMKEGVQEMGNK